MPWWWRGRVTKVEEGLTQAYHKSWEDPDANDTRLGDASLLLI
jgi:hypothetical protein